MKLRLNPFGLILATGAVLSVTWALSRAQSVHRLPKYLLTNKKLVLLSTPQIVAGPLVLDAKWSPDGVHIAAVRRTERQVLENTVSEMRLVLWSAGRQSHELWHMDMIPDQVPHVTWMSPDVVTVELKWHETVTRTDPSGKVTGADIPHQDLLWVNVGHEQVKTVPLVPGDHLFMSPSRPFAAFLSPSQHQLTLLRPDGTRIKAVPLPEKTDWPRFHVEDEWSDDGIHVGLDATEPGPNNAQVLRPYVLNIQTGELKPGAQPEAVPHKASTPLVRLVQSEQAVAFGRRTQKVHPLWLASTDGGEQPETMLASDSTGGKLSPTGESVLYTSEQAAWVTTLRFGPKEPFLKNLFATLQSNAKQLGIAMVMYAQDYDETYPSQDISVESAFQPYHKNDDLYEGFNYTFAGGSLVTIPNPADTQLGTVDGPGGHFVIYVDGHVRWVPN